jgi:hypothetical protein
LPHFGAKDADFGLQRRFDCKVLFGHGVNKLGGTGFSQFPAPIVPQS